MQTRKVLYLERNAGRSLIGRIMAYFIASTMVLFVIIEILILHGV